MDKLLNPHLYAWVNQNFILVYHPLQCRDMPARVGSSGSGQWRNQLSCKSDVDSVNYEQSNIKLLLYNTIYLCI